MPALGTQRKRPTTRIRVDRRRAPRGLPSDLFRLQKMSVWRNPPEISTQFVNPIEPTHPIGVSITPDLARRKGVQAALARHQRTGAAQRVNDLIIGVPKGMEKAQRVLLLTERENEEVKGNLTKAERARKQRSHRERDAVRGLIASSASVPVQAVGDRFYHHRGNFYTYANFTVAPVGAVVEGRAKYVGPGQVPLLRIRNPRAIAILSRAFEARRAKARV